MVDYREILRYSSLGYSRKQISLTVHSSHHTVEDTLNAAQEKGIAWPLDDDITDADLQEILFPGKYAYASPFTNPDYAKIHSELARKGVTLTLLWHEYCDNVRATGGVPYMYTQFCEKYRKWARITKATMRISHKPGDAMQVDWAGDPLWITDKVTGEMYPGYLFVAVLPCSWYTYAEVCGDTKSENWLLCHVHAFHYFGGVTRLLIPDNAKTGVIANNRYETILNKSYQEMADHYGTAIVPARVRKPDDKAAAEGSVRYVSTWITAALRDRTFFSVSEAQQAVAEKLEEVNRAPFQKRPGCRLSAFEQEEKEFLRPLPILGYEPSVWSQVKVGMDYLISDGKNKYSIPYDLIGETVDVRLTRDIVEVFYRGSRVAAHVRLETAQRDPVVKLEHMPEAHRKYIQYNAEEFAAWASGIGRNTADVVRYFLTSGKEVEQGYKSCASLTKLAKSYGNAVLEDACERILRLTSVPTIRNISTLCRSSADRKTAGEEAAAKQESHGGGITRGASYYSKGGRRHDEAGND
ncbi:MAG: IS21 family transposase [Clostridia bacterium]|nr:IS21 family transposase [Clostridia bacterium]